jgi:carbon-monoxide dehydrogenase large subunit
VTRSNAYIGTPVERIEDRRLLSGSGTYVGDLNPAGLLHAVVLRSSVAHGAIRKIDASAARSYPEVAAVITAAEIGEVPIIPFRQHAIPQAEPYRQPVIARAHLACPRVQSCRDHSLMPSASATLPPPRGKSPTVRNVSTRA